MDLLKKDHNSNGPFNMVYIDHTLLDIYLISSNTGEFIGRPWLTVLYEYDSSKILSFYLSFETPSYKSIMAVIDDAAEKYKRKPSKIVVNKGEEFNNDYLDTFLAEKSFKKILMPTYTAINIERLFQNVNSQIQNIKNSMCPMEEVIHNENRSFNKKDNIGGTLADLYTNLSKYVDENGSF